MYIFNNPNPIGAYIGDCVVRAISIAENRQWVDVYTGLCLQGLLMYDMPSSNRVWGEYLRINGYDRYLIPQVHPDYYTIKDFCEEYPRGVYILGTGTHVVTVIDGNYLDTWDSGDESPLCYWIKEE